MASKNNVIITPMDKMRHKQKTDKTKDILADYLCRNARHLSAFQAISLIENMLDGGQEVGTHNYAHEEKLFFDVEHALRFPLSDVVDIQPIHEKQENVHHKTRGSERYRMRVTFLGLHGSGTPLPSFYAEKIARYDAQESVSKSFFDFFHNRIIGLLYRGWRKFRYYRRYQPGGRDLFSQWIYSLFGLGSAASRASTHINWSRLLCFAGMLSTRNRSAALISCVLAHAFELPSVHIEQWIKRRVSITPTQKNALGQANARLGDNFVIGGQAYDIQGKIRICISELTFKRLQDFLPQAQDFKMLRSLVEFMLRDQISYDLKLGLKPGQAYPITLSKDCLGRLGWSSFLAGERDRQQRDVIIRVRR